MDFERWVSTKVDDLKMKIVAENSGLPTPQKILDRISKTDPNARNSHGETIMISIIRYVLDDVQQIKFLNILLRAGANPNLSDLKHGRTPLMYACQERKKAVVRLLTNVATVDMKLKDKLGNNALMHAAMVGDTEMIAILMARLSTTWSFDVFSAKNLSGKTAQNIAISNGKVNCAFQMKKERVNMLKNMHKQMSTVKRSTQIKGWGGIGQAAKFGKVWHKKSALNLAKSSRNTSAHSLLHSHRLSQSTTFLPKIDEHRTLERAKSETYIRIVDSFLNLALLV